MCTFFFEILSLNILNDKLIILLLLLRFTGAGTGAMSRHKYLFLVISVQRIRFSSPNDFKDTPITEERK